MDNSVESFTEIGETGIYSTIPVITIGLRIHFNINIWSEVLAFLVNQI